jgi:hypothetical protein
MRITLVALFLATGLSSAISAETKVFIIANQADGYGVDRCLATAASCGTVLANSYCRARDFEQAVSYRLVDREDIAGTIPVAASCPGINCPGFIAIECTR